MKQVACGSDHTICVDLKGDVYTWGLGAYGNLGHGDTMDMYEPKLVTSLVGRMIKQVGAGSKHSIALSSRGDVFTWGHGENGRLGHGTVEVRVAAGGQASEGVGWRASVGSAMQAALTRRRALDAPGLCAGRAAAAVGGGRAGSVRRVHLRGRGAQRCAAALRCKPVRARARRVCGYVTPPRGLARARPQPP